MSQKCWPLQQQKWWHPVHLWFIHWHPRTHPESNSPCYDLWKGKHNSGITMAQEGQSHNRLDYANSNLWQIHWWIPRTLPTSCHGHDSTSIPLPTYTLTPQTHQCGYDQGRPPWLIPELGNWISIYTLSPWQPCHPPNHLMWFSLPSQQLPSNHLSHHRNRTCHRHQKS